MHKLLEFMCRQCVYVSAMCINKSVMCVFCFVGFIFQKNIQTLPIDIQTSKLLGMAISTIISVLLI